MQDTFYDSAGRPIAYVQDGINVYRFSGEPVAYLDGSSLWSFSGTHLGWFENGWVLDNSGRYALFTENATGGPLKPTKRIKPVKSVKSVKPVKSVRSLKPMHPIRVLAWSGHSGDQLFED
jgi:hypothetical protein